MLWMAPKLDATKNLESSSQVIEVIEITKIESVKIVFPVKNFGLELHITASHGLHVHHVYDFTRKEGHGAPPPLDCI